MTRYTQLPSDRLKFCIVVFFAILSQTILIAERIYEPNEGIFAFEVEDQNEVDEWSLLTDVEGFSGSGFFRWDGANFFGGASKGIMQYKLNVSKPGYYSVKIHNYHGFNPSSEHNDVWIRFNDGEWIKLYNHVTFAWNWFSLAENAHHHPGWNSLAAGINTFEVAGRSSGFAIDRVHIFHAASVDEASVENFDVPLSEYTDTNTELKARFVSRPNYGAAPLHARFDLSLVELPEGRRIESAVWELDDLGATSYNQTVTYRYSLPGTYDVKLTVVDDLGHTHTTEATTTVTSGEGGGLHIHDLTSSPHYGGDTVNRLLDDNSKTRWSVDEKGGWAQFDMGGAYPINGVELAFYRGHLRTYTIDILASNDGKNFTAVLESHNSSGESDEYERIVFEALNARYLRIVGQGNDTNDFTQITRAKVLGSYNRLGWFTDATATDGWLDHPKLGWFNLKNYPWVYSPYYGFIYPTSTEQDKCWVFNIVAQSWSYLNLDLFPWIYDSSYGKWLYLFYGTDAKLHAFDATEEEWIVLSEN
jgi:PKD repeat protein